MKEQSSSILKSTLLWKYFPLSPTFPEVTIFSCIEITNIQKEIDVLLYHLKFYLVNYNPVSIIQDFQGISQNGHLIEQFNMSFIIVILLNCLELIFSDTLYSFDLEEFTLWKVPSKFYFFSFTFSLISP